MAQLAWTRPKALLGPVRVPRARGGGLRLPVTAAELSRDVRGGRRGGRRERDRSRRRERRQRRVRSRRARYATSGSEDDGRYRRRSGSSWSEEEGEEGREGEPARRLAAYCVAEELSTADALEALRPGRAAHSSLPGAILPGIPVRWVAALHSDVLHLCATPKHGADVDAALASAGDSASVLSGLSALPAPLPGGGSSLNGGQGEGGDGQLALPPSLTPVLSGASPLALPAHPRRLEGAASLTLPPATVATPPSPPATSRSFSAGRRRRVPDRGTLSDPRAPPTDAWDTVGETEKESDAEAAAGERAALQAQLEAQAERREAERREREGRQRAAKRAELHRAASADVFVFPYGCVVCWGWPEAAEAAFLAALGAAGVLQQPLLEPEGDDMEWHYSGDAGEGEEGAAPGKTALAGDDVALASTTAAEKLAVSYAFAQSCKLSVSETLVDLEIEASKHVPVELAASGTIRLTAQDVAKQIGRLFILRTGVNLTSDILDSPEVFWEDDAYEPTYELVQAYLDLEARVEIVNTRLDIIRELLDMLSAQLENQHASRLEWIIIWLIVAEVVLELASMLWNHFSTRQEEY